LRARFILTLASVLTACRAAPPGHTAAVDAAAPAAPSASTAAQTDPLAERRNQAAENMRMDCRAVGAKGDIRILSENDTDEGKPLVTDAEIPSDAWLSLSPGARIVAKDPRTTRETIFTGPARVRACAGHREDSWVASGVFESTPGAGETPGAEEWVVTPFAVVRFAAAKLRVTVRSEGATILLAGGAAFVRAEGDARTQVVPGPDGGACCGGAKGQEPWLRMSEGGTVEIRPVRRLAPLQAARSAVDECSALSDRAHALAQMILPHEIGDGGPSSLGNAIVEQVTTRRLARAACAVAKLRVQALPTSPERIDWSATLARDEGLWSTFSSNPPPR
jgi:hypothetical protein